VLKNSAASARRSLWYSPPDLVDQVYPIEEVSVARTNIVLDDDLIQQAMQVSGAKTKREAVDRALREMVARRPVYRALRKLRGKLPWEGDVDAGRRRRG
jgi:Arc/MetJ family transcription regulator